MSANQTDPELLASRSPECFGVFYERHVDAVTAYALRRGGHAEQAFDVVAETFARALEHRERFDSSRGPAIAWLLAIARNLLLDAARRGQVADAYRQRLGIAALALDDEQLALVHERGSVDLSEALRALPIEQRDALVARVLAEEPYSSIARRSGSSEQAVRQRVSRGLAALRQYVKEGT